MKKSRKCYRCVSTNTLKCSVCDKLVCDWHQKSHMCYHGKFEEVKN